MSRASSITSGDEVFEQLSISLEVEWANRPGRYTTWIKDVGDWSYGIYVAGVRTQGEWIQFVGPAMPANAWMSFHGHVIEVTDVRSFQESIVSLDSLAARWPDGTRRTIQPGGYKILTVAGERVQFREEIDMDSVCSYDAKPPAIMPPVLSTTVAELFEADGTPRFSTMYTKGC